MFYISIHALLAESDPVILFRVKRTSISIHALLAESDTQMFYETHKCFIFLSTLSLRRATTHPISVLITEIISIHALLAESDQQY